MWAPARAGLNSWMTGTRPRAAWRNRVCPPHLKTCYPLESRVSSRVPLPGTHPCRLPLSPGPPSPAVSQPARRGTCFWSNYQAGRNSGGSVEGWSLQESLGMAPVALVQGVGRRQQRRGAVCNRKAQMPWPVRSSRAVLLHLQTAQSGPPTTSSTPHSLP